MPDAELTLLRDTLFKSIAGTFDHILVVGGGGELTLKVVIIRTMRVTAAKHCLFPASRSVCGK
jgi:hypothetical protein